MEVKEKPHRSMIWICFNFLHANDEEKALSFMTNHMDGDAEKAIEIIKSMKSYEENTCIEFTESNLSEVDRIEDPLFTDEYHPYSTLSQFFVEYDMEIIPVQRFKGISGTPDTFIIAGTPFRLDESKIKAVWRTISVNNSYRKKIARINAIMEDDEEEGEE